MAGANGHAASEFYAEIQAQTSAYKFYLNGAWKESSSGKTVAIQNPSTRQTAYTVQGGFGDSLGTRILP